jgi:hypothetical protein
MAVLIEEYPDDFGIAYEHQVVMIHCSDEDGNMEWCRTTLGRRARRRHTRFGEHEFQLFFDGDPPRMCRFCHLPRENYATVADAPRGMHAIALW